MSDIDSSVASGSGDGAASAPSGNADPTAGGFTTGDGGTGSLASAGGGSAPAPGGDAALGGLDGQAPQAPPQTLSEFQFANRKFRDQKAAEDYFRSQVGRVPETQRKLAEYERQVGELTQTVSAFQRMMASGQVGGQGQGAANGPAAPAGEQDFAERFAQKELPWLMEQLNHPEQGAQRFTVGLAHVIGQELRQQREQIMGEIQARDQRQAQERAVGSAFGVARNLAQDFPELDEHNSSPEAIEHQQAFIENLKQFPQGFAAENPQFAMLAAALVTRHQYGTPMVAQPPGTSGSPSARALLASEQALAGAVGSPIQGNGTPRPRPIGAGEMPEDRIRRENAAAPGNFRSPSGRDLGFGPA
jgi:hypothetical protein